MIKPPKGPVALKPPRALLFGLFLATGAFLVAACGGSPSNQAVAHLATTTTRASGQANGAKSGDGPGPGGGSGGAPSGGAPSGGGGSGGGQSQFSIAGGSGSQMLAYAQCMRSHGVANFPDPNGQGVISGSGINPGSASFQAANKDCRHFMPNGGQPSPAQQAQAMAQALKFSECMRAHGISDFPDPQSGPGGGIAIRIRAGQGSDLNPQNPQFQAAQTACQSIMGGPKGGKFSASGGPSKS
jgi:hypothetical protein